MSNEFANLKPKYSKFIVKNNSTKSVKIFNVKISPGREFDLLTLPGISEQEIVSSVLKDDLGKKIRGGELTVTLNTIDSVTVNLPDSNYTLDNSYFDFERIAFSGTLSTTRDIVFPNYGTTTNSWLVTNNTNQNIIVKTLLGSGVVISPGTSSQVFSNGTNISGSSSFIASDADTGTVLTKQSDNTVAFEYLNDAYLKGSYRTVSNLTERNAIVSDLRKEGMLVYLRDIDIVYKLGSGLTNSDWFIYKETVSVQDLSELALLNDSECTENIEFIVLSLKDSFYLDKTSTVTADGITVINSLSSSSGASPGRWVRRTIYSSVWASQATWYIDPTSGNNENTGLASGTAIKTWSELTRRLGAYAVVKIPITINILGNLPESDPLFWRPTITDTGGLIIDGVLTQVSTGTFTAVTARNRATNTCTMIEDTSHAISWSADVGRLVKITASVSAASVGASAGIAKDLGSYQTRTATFLKYTNSGATGTITEIVPQIGDTYAVYTQTQVGVCDLIIDKPPVVAANAILVRNLHMINGTKSHQLIMQAGALTLQAVDCRVSRSITLSGMRFINVTVDGIAGITCIPGHSAAFTSYYITLYGGVSILRQITGNFAYLLGGFFVQAPTAAGAIFISAGSRCRIEDAGVMDWGGFLLSAVNITNGAQLETGQYNLTSYLWGTSATANTYALSIEGGKFFVNSPTNITIAGALTATQDFRVSGRITLPAIDYSVNPPAFTTLRNCTWANLNLAVASGGFGGSAIDPATGCGIAEEIG